WQPPRGRPLPAEPLLELRLQDAEPSGEPLLDDGGQVGARRQRVAQLQERLRILKKEDLGHPLGSQPGENSPLEARVRVERGLELVHRGATLLTRAARDDVERHFGTTEALEK